MKSALILHGAGNNSEGNWFPWLKKELEEKGYIVWSPDLPHADTPNQKEWLDFIFSNKKFSFTSETILIGHSAGATLILRILEKLPLGIKVDEAILVAGPIDKGDIPEFYKYKEDLTKDPVDWEKVKASCSSFVYFVSDNDPYDCGERHAKIMQKKLGGKLIVKSGQGHFNLEVGEQYREFPDLLEYI